MFTHGPARVIGSASFAAEVSARHDVDPGRWTIVSGATDTGPFVPHREPGAPGGEDGTQPSTLLHHGRVDARKGVLDLLEAHRALLDAGRAVRLVVSGIGPERDLVAARMTELELEAPVEQLGDTPDERARTRWTGGATCSSVDNGVLVPAKDPQALAGAIARRRGRSRPAASSRCSGTSPRSGSSPAPPGRSRRRTPRSSRGPPSSTRASRADVDYVALRREEDRRALAALGVPGRHLGLLEAPHPGHGSPAALFTDRHAGDDGLAVDVGPVPVGKIEAVDRHATRVPFQFGSAAAAGPH